MRILYLINSSSIHAERCIKYFAQMGHEIHALGFESPKRNIDGVHYHIIPTNKKLLFITLPFKLFQFHKTIKIIQPDIIDAHYVIKYGFIAALMDFHPIIITAWGSDLFVQPKPKLLWRFIAKYALKKADLVVCLSSTLKEEISKLGIEIGRLRTILLGVDTEKFHPMSRDERLKKQLGIGKFQPVVISTRKLSAIYNVESLIRAVPRVLAEIPQTKFVIIGNGEQEEYLHEVVKTLCVSESVKFVGWVIHNQLPKYLSLADIYVSTSISDGASNSLFEAMACELTSVVSDIPANHPWIEDGENGFLFPEKDYETLASRIIYTINNEEERKNFGKKSRKIVQRKAEHKVGMDKLEKTYENLVREKGK